jgi:hypothetical protein
METARDSIKKFFAAFFQKRSACPGTTGQIFTILPGR